MKKTLAVLSILATSAAFAATTVDSANEFGFVPVTGLSQGLKAVSVSVAGYSTGDATSIRIAEILQTTGLSVGDKLYTLGDDGKYTEYTLTKGDTADTWTPSRIVTVGANGTLVAADGTPATEATIARGKAFWLDTQATSVYLMGQATTGTAEVTLSAGWNLIGSSSMTDPMPVSSVGGASGSRLNVGSVSYQKGKNGAWLKLPNYEAVTSSDVIPVGQGAMLLKK